MSLGTNAAYVYSVISAVHRRALHGQGVDIDNMGFFETSALLITFISLGKYLESHAKGRTSQVRPIRALLVPSSLANGVCPAWYRTMLRCLTAACVMPSRLCCRWTGCDGAAEAGAPHGGAADKE